MSDILEQIAIAKRFEVEQMKIARPLDQLLAAKPSAEPISFAAALRGPKPVKVIAELKKASPSKGVLIENFRPAMLAAQYRDGGAVALSVLTERQFFQGSPEFMRLAKNASSLPVLCKDFIIDPYQIHLAAQMGADAILLIVKLLTRQTLSQFIQLAKQCKMDAMVEAHTEGEVEIAVDSGAEIIGVNSRNLGDFSVSLQNTVDLGKRIPDDRIKVAESGIFTRDDIRHLAKAGYSCFLIGEALVRSENLVQLLKDLQTT